MSEALKSALALTLLSLLLAGCVPVAWVVPPTQLDIGVGAASGLPVAEPALAVPFGVSVHPLAFPKQLSERPYDFAVGYRGILSFAGQSDQASAAHSTYLEASFLHLPTTQGFWSRGLNRLRVGVSGRGKLLFGPAIAGPQLGVGMRFFVEFVRFDDRQGAECNIANFTSWFCGYSRAYGERGWGLYVEAQRSLSFADAYTGIYTGIYMRLPASAGAGFVGSLD